MEQGKADKMVVDNRENELGYALEAVVKYIDEIEQRATELERLVPAPGLGVRRIPTAKINSMRARSFIETVKCKGVSDREVSRRVGR